MSLPARFPTRPSTDTVAVDVDTDEILAFVVTDEKVGDISCTERLMDLVMAAGHDVGILLADTGYDSKENWNRYSRMGIKVCININSTQVSERHAAKYPSLIRSHGCVVRGNHMRRSWRSEGTNGGRRTVTT